MAGPAANVYQRGRGRWEVPSELPIDDGGSYRPAERSVVTVDEPVCERRPCVPLDRRNLLRGSSAGVMRGRRVSVDGRGPERRHVPRGDLPNGLDDPPVARTPTQVPGEADPDLLFGGVGVVT